MALVTTTVSPTVRVTPFTGISETARERSGIARAEVVYSAYGLWPATGVGDNRSISFSFTLDPDYGYSLMDSNAAFIKAAVDEIHMEATGVMEITTDTGPGASQKETQWYPYRNLASRANANPADTLGGIKINQYNTTYPVTGSNAIMVFSMDIKPTALLYPFPGVNSIDCTAMFGEQPTNQTVIAYRFYCRFLQYDIIQGYNYVVNSPVMTR
jgi:hypothetical protein